MNNKFSLITQSAIARGVVGVVAIAGATAANAAIDVSSVTSAISDGTTAAGVIGGAVLAFVALVAVFKKVRGAI